MNFSGKQAGKIYKTMEANPGDSLLFAVENMHLLTIHIPRDSTPQIAIALDFYYVCNNKSCCCLLKIFCCCRGCQILGMCCCCQALICSAVQHLKWFEFPLIDWGQYSYDERSVDPNSSLNNDVFACWVSNVQYVYSSEIISLFLSCSVSKSFIHGFSIEVVKSIMLANIASQSIWCHD